MNNELPAHIVIENLSDRHKIVAYCFDKNMIDQSSWVEAS